MFRNLLNDIFTKLNKNIIDYIEFDTSNNLKILKEVL
jgi:hypothetical protein